MKDICFYFQVHQPMRLRRIKAFETSAVLDYWDDAKNRAIFDRAADKCYLPANRTIAEMVRASDGAFRAAFSLSGVFLEQAERYRPDVLESFAELRQTGCVEFLSETYYHSLAGLWPEPHEFVAQVKAHRRAMERLVGPTSRVFRNTELIYDDRIATRVANLGYDAVLTEGTERILGDRSPNHVYRPGHEPGLRLLLKNYRLSDDVAFRFSSQEWTSWPLTADTYAQWLADTPGDLINLFMDYETFGEHQWPETGIFDFLWHVPKHVAQHEHLRFALPSEVARRHAPVGDVQAPSAISWADTERDVSAWLGNKMQHACFERLRALGPEVHAAGDAELEHAWRLLQTSDHLYYACTKWMGDGDIHQYFSPYDSPYMAYINHMNAIEDLATKLRARPRPSPAPREMVRVAGSMGTPAVRAPEHQETPIAEAAR